MTTTNALFAASLANYGFDSSAAALDFLSRCGAAGLCARRQERRPYNVLVLVASQADLALVDELSQGAPGVYNPL